MPHLSFAAARLNCEGQMGVRSFLWEGANWYVFIVRWAFIAGVIGIVLRVALGPFIGTLAVKVTQTDGQEAYVLVDAIAYVVTRSDGSTIVFRHGGSMGTLRTKETSEAIARGAWNKVRALE
jgi:hypothetical protein